MKKKTEKELLKKRIIDEMVVKPSDIQREKVVNEITKEYSYLNNPEDKTIIRKLYEKYKKKN